MFIESRRVYDFDQEIGSFDRISELESDLALIKAANIAGNTVDCY